MTLPQVKVRPLEEYQAEVVVLITTLGTKRSEYNAGKRVRDLLEIKRAHHKIVDFNRDARQIAAEMQGRAIQKLTLETSKYRKLHTDSDDDLVLPQVFIDGLYIGDECDLQGLEDDGYLTHLLRRENCPARVGKQQLCNNPREPGETHCSKCGESFEEILPDYCNIDDYIAECDMLDEYEN